jgi:hypothetical protein
VPKGFEAAGDAPNGELLDDAPKGLLDPNMDGWLIAQQPQNQKQPVV